MLRLCLWIALSGNPDSTLTVMKRVADWQMRQTSPYPAWDWVNGVYYTGMMALAKTSGDTTYSATLYRIGEALAWQTGPHRTMADDYCIAQTYVQLGKIDPFRGLADSIASAPHTESLEWKNNIQQREWAWCDALFMGPPALAYLATATHDRRYLDLADSLWWKTTNYLYDPKDSLYYRDSRFFVQREANGQPVFWSRGNGWVLAGLVRVLENMPENYPDKARFVRLYHEMAYKIAGLQQGDGTWRSSLLDPASYPAEETSGTALYCYALAWGMNHRLLPAKTFRPAVSKAWRALEAAVQPDGRLGYVQRIGEKPGQTNANSTEAYGTGAFLLAGSEVYKMPYL
jgi:unsaturated rhamnogalacturonyl hydrolase